MKVEYLIVDDEPLARKLVASHAAKIETLELVGECSTAIEAANFLRTRTVNLIFLDVQMPELSGLDFLRTLKKPPAIILVTAYRDFAIDAFELDVLDYLLKPISFERFLKSVNKFLDSQLAAAHTSQKEEKVSDYIYLKSGRKDHKVHIDQLLYIESLDDYVKVFLKDKVLVTHENISTLEKRLPTNYFVRTHRSFLVSLNHIQAVSAEGVQVNGKDLPFGRTFKKSALTSIYRKQSRS